jgi:hypothetical protein
VEVGDRSGLRRIADHPRSYGPWRWQVVQSYDVRPAIQRTIAKMFWSRGRCHKATHRIRESFGWAEEQLVALARDIPSARHELGRELRRESAGRSRIEMMVIDGSRDHCLKFPSHQRAFPTRGFGAAITLGRCPADDDARIETPAPPTHPGPLGPLRSGISRSSVTTSGSPLARHRSSRVGSVSTRVRRPMPRAHLLDERGESGSPSMMRHRPGR